MTVRVGINGFGRIGRSVLRRAHKVGPPEIEIVAVNDLADIGTLVHLVKYDSTHGRFDGSVEAGEKELLVNGQLIKVFSESDPSRLPWRALSVDVVLESTGQFTSRTSASRHLEAGATKVLISAPAEEVDVTLVYGINHRCYDPVLHEVISAASCTANCLAPLIKVVRDNFGWVHGFMTTVHPYTSDQRLIDSPHRDLRRARSAALSIIPTTTGSIRATSEVIPDVEGKLQGMSFRVPTASVSVVNLTVEIERPTTSGEVNDAFRSAAAGGLQGILEVCNEPLVSSDYVGNPHSSSVDTLSTQVTDGTLVHIVSWHDNETGYATRCLDLLSYIATTLPTRFDDSSTTARQIAEEVRSSSPLGADTR